MSQLRRHRIRRVAVKVCRDRSQARVVRGSAWPMGVLHVLQRHAGCEQFGGEGMPQAVGPDLGGGGDAGSAVEAAVARPRESSRHGARVTRKWPPMAPVALLCRRPYDVETFIRRTCRHARAATRVPPSAASPPQTAGVYRIDDPAPRGLAQGRWAGGLQSPRGPQDGGQHHRHDRHHQADQPPLGVLRGHDRGDHHPSRRFRRWPRPA
jgi:hypothetical protein